MPVTQTVCALEKSSVINSWDGALWAQGAWSRGERGAVVNGRRAVCQGTRCSKPDRRDRRHPGTSDSKVLVSETGKTCILGTFFIGFYLILSLLSFES